jgi:hypothetical protein
MSKKEKGQASSAGRHGKMARIIAKLPLTGLSLKRCKASTESRSIPPYAPGSRASAVCVFRSLVYSGCLPPEDILTAYPYLEAADIRQSLEYAAFLAEDENLELTR